MIRSSGSGVRAQRRHTTECSPVGSLQRGHAGPSSTSDAAHGSQNGVTSLPHPAHCGRNIQSSTDGVVDRVKPRLRTSRVPATVDSDSFVIDRCYVYQPAFVDDATHADVLAWLATLHPLWEMRY